VKGWLAYERRRGSLRSEVSGLLQGRLGGGSAGGEATLPCTLAEVSQQETRGGAEKGRSMDCSDGDEELPAEASTDVWEKQRTRGEYEEG
jgi:hypothetical protein